MELDTASMVALVLLITFVVSEYVSLFHSFRETRKKRDDDKAEKRGG